LDLTVAQADIRHLDDNFLLLRCVCHRDSFLPCQRSTSLPWGNSHFNNLWEYIMAVQHFLLRNPDLVLIGCDVEHLATL
jgi:hypothetical protein